MSAFLLLVTAAALAGGQTGEGAATPSQSTPPQRTSPAEFGDIGKLGLPAAAAAQLRSALNRKDLKSAQELLLARLRSTQPPDQGRPLLLLLGSIYFLSHDALQAAIAWQKAARSGPLPEQVRFSLAMAYIQIRRGDWAFNELLALQRNQPANALYPFWLGRIRYDDQKYGEAAGYFRTAIALDPKFSRAHDNLGLCLYDMNDVDGAIAEYDRAIELQRNTPGASAWPYLNLGIAEEFRGHTDPALHAFRHALDLDPRFAQAHYHLGNLYASVDRLTDAIIELKTASTLDPTYAEPHAVLARVYRRTGDREQSNQQVLIYRGLTKKKSGVN